MTNFTDGAALQKDCKGRRTSKRILKGYFGLIAEKRFNRGSLRGLGGDVASRLQYQAISWS